jgi:uncharacterized protein (DUF697 family)
VVILAITKNSRICSVATQKGEIAKAIINMGTRAAISTIILTYFGGVVVAVVTTAITKQLVQVIRNDAFFNWSFYG